MNEEPEHDHSYKLVGIADGREYWKCECGDLKITQQLKLEGMDD